MKKLIIMSATVFMLAVTANAQAIPVSLKSGIKTDKNEKKAERKELRKLEGTEVSYQSKQAFYEDFGNITPISSERLDNFDEFTFRKDGNVISAFYDADSKLVGTTQSKQFTDLPASAQKMINKKYAGYTPLAVVFYDDNEFNETDMILYDMQFDDEDSYFVELKKDNKEIVLQVKMDGEVFYFTRLM